MGQPEQQAEGAGPFVTRLTSHPPGGGTVVRESRDARRRGTVAVRPNQLGSVLFMVSAVAALDRPATGDLVSTGIANRGTLTGALCFSVAGVLQLCERP
ncbi:hypothetical protein ACWELO_30870 [Streptomyces sp. NPDC004596]|uniref:hypothetical protein n=1 Tax=Streptomyces sp. DSM 118148 TaxID=3448667 RepID=UPI00403FDF89